MRLNHVTVLGAGSWGTALAILLSRHGKPVTLWGHHAKRIEQMQQQRSNPFYLPDLPFPEVLQLESDINKAIEPADLVLMVVPSHAFRETLRAGRSSLQSHQHIAWATKGMEHTSSKFMHTLVAEELGDDIKTAVISGPTFAAEVARGLPTAITVASGDQPYAEAIGRRLHDETFRAYTSHDVIGVEVGGSIKNVLAIAAGVADGLGFGANTRAALITRGLSELTRLGIALGGQAETFMGLAGMGDLVLTCTDNQSRNRRFGLALARGLSAEQARKEIGQVVEGEYSAKEAWQLAQDYQVDMPITEQVYRILFENLDPHTAVHNLLGRQLKAEDDDSHAY